MSVTVDHETLQVEQLGLRTVGQVLSHLQRDNRLVVNLLIDGEQPNLDQLPEVRRAPVNGHTLFIETAEPREMALEVIAEVESQLNEADRLKSEAVDLLRRSGGAGKAMERLSGCFSTWHNAQESVVKTAQLLRIDLSVVHAAGRNLADLVSEFSGQLRQVKQALEGRDYVTLGDVLAYEMTETSAHWRAALAAIREIIN